MTIPDKVSPVNWAHIETLLNVAVLTMQVGMNANNISAHVRKELYDINESLAPIPTPENQNG